MSLPSRVLKIFLCSFLFLVVFSSTVSSGDTFLTIFTANNSSTLAITCSENVLLQDDFESYSSRTFPLLVDGKAYFNAISDPADIWTNKGGRGYGTHGGSFTIGESIEIYFKVDRYMYIEVWDELPDGSVKVLVQGYVNGGETYQITGTIGEPAGYRILYLVDQYGNVLDSCRIDVAGGDGSECQLEIISVELYDEHTYEQIDSLHVGDEFRVVAKIKNVGSTTLCYGPHSLGVEYSPEDYLEEHPLLCGTPPQELQPGEEAYVTQCGWFKALKPGTVTLRVYVDACVGHGDVCTCTGEECRATEEINVEIQSEEVNPDPLGEDIEPDSYTNAYRLNLPDYIDGAYVYGDDEDWYVFTLNQAATVNITTYPPSQSDDADTKIYLYDSNLNLIGSDDDSGYNYYSQLIIDLDPGTYYLEVRRYDYSDPIEGSGYYNLAVILESTSPEITGCTVISSPGYYYLANDIINSNADVCIKITSSDVILDGRGHVIDGVEVIDGTGSSTGIKVSNSNNITIKNLTITDWYWAIYLDHVGDSKIENCSFSGNEESIELWRSNTNVIANNTFDSNREGILLSDGSDNVIKFNTFSDNAWYGLEIYGDNNIIYLNNFIDNNEHILNYGINKFVSPTPITYTYNGKTFTNYLGNYYDDYSGSDANGDGIGDTPYVIDSNNQDDYPLIEPFENYFGAPKNGTLTVHVYDINDVPASESGGVTTVEIIKGYQTIAEEQIDADSKVVFSVEPGDYRITVWHNDNGYREYWGYMDVTVNAGEDKVLNFHRNQPYVKDVRAETETDGQIKIYVNITVPLNSPSDIQYVKSEITLKKESEVVYQDESYDVAVARGVTQTFVFTFTPTDYGTYSILAEAYVVGGGELRTDAYGWVEFDYSPATLTVIVYSYKSGRLLPPTGGNIVVKVLDYNGNLVDEKSKNFKGRELGVDFQFIVNPGNYRIRVYVTPNTGPQYMEYWGETEVSVSSNTKVKFYKNTLKIKNVEIDRESLLIRNNPTVFGDIEINVSLRNYGDSDVKAKAIVIIDDEKDHLHPDFKAESDVKTIASGGIASFTIHVTNLNPGKYNLTVVSYGYYNNEWVVTSQRDWENFTLLPEPRPPFNIYKDTFSFENLGTEVSRGMCFGMTAVVGHFFGWNHNGYEFEKDGKTYYAKLVLPYSNLYEEAEEPILENGKIAEMTPHLLAIVLYQDYQDYPLHYGIPLSEALQRIESGQLVQIHINVKETIDDRYEWHSIVAYDYLKDCPEMGGYCFYVYDPNYPGLETVLTYNPAQNEIKLEDHYYDINEIKFRVVRPLTYKVVDGWLPDFWDNIEEYEKLSLFKVAMSNLPLKLTSGTKTGYFDNQGIFRTAISNTAGFMDYYTDGNQVIEKFFAVAYPKDLKNVKVTTETSELSNLKKDPVTIISFGETVTGIKVEANHVSINDTGNGYIIDTSGTTNIMMFEANDERVETIGASLPGGIIIATTNQISYDADRDGTIDDVLEPPEANFDYTISGLTVTFDASSSYDPDGSPDGSIVSYEWDFGDGNSATTSSPIVQHTYTQSGNYTVTLTVTDNDGVKSSTTKTITVNATINEYDHDKDGVVRADLDDLWMQYYAYQGFESGDEYDHDKDGIIRGDLDDLWMQYYAYQGFIGGE